MNFFLKLRKYYQIIKGRILAFKPFISLSDYILRLFRYIGAGAELVSSTVQKMMAGMADMLDGIVIIVDSVQFFFNNKKRNLQVFFDTIIKPIIYLIISSLSTAGIYGFKQVVTALAMGGLHIGEAIGGLFGMGARTLIQTISRLVSFIRLITVGNASHLSSKEKRQVEEEIYSNMEPMSAVIVSALLVVGGIGIVTGGVAYLAIAGVGIGAIVANRMYAFLNSKFAEEHLPWLYNKVQQAKTWVRQHEPIFVKKAVSYIKSIYHALRDNLFGKKPIIHSSIIITEEQPENKKWRWGMIESNLADARMKQPRSVAQINQQTQEMIELGRKEKKLNTPSILALRSLRDFLSTLSTDKEASLNSLRELQDTHAKTLHSFTLGVGSVAALYQEAEALITEDIGLRINKYKENMEKDFMDYLPNPERLLYFFDYKWKTLESMRFLEKVNSQIDSMIENPAQNQPNDFSMIIDFHDPKATHGKLIKAMIDLDPSFKQSLSEQGERAKIVEAMINKIERYKKSLSISFNA